MPRIDELIRNNCPDGVNFCPLGSLCKIETGKLNANAATEDGDYMFFTTAKEPGRIDKYRWDTEALLVAGNANIGDVKHYVGKFEAYQRTYVLTDFDAKVMPRFLYFVLRNNLKQYLDSHKNEAAMTYIVLSTLENFRIPVPPFEVQQEIVGMLNSFTELEAELEAELTKRKQQYGFYRDKLLSYDNLVKNAKKVDVLPLEDVCKLTTGATPSRVRKEYWEGGSIPWMNSGEVNLRKVFSTEEKITEEGYSKTSTTIVPAHSVVIALAGQGKTRGKVAITEIDLCTNQSLCSMTCNEKMDYRYLFHYLDSKYNELRTISNGDGTRGGLSLRILKPYKIPVPDKETQLEIIRILDNFDEVCSDINSGLPAEINARHKQYEYYRDKLLTFKEKVVQ